MTMQTIDDSEGTIPPVIQPEFVMTSLNEAVPLVTDHFRVFENGALIGIVQGVLSQRWLPKPGIELRGVLETDASRTSLHGALVLEIPQLGTNCEMTLTRQDVFGTSRNIVGSLRGIHRMPPSVERVKFYLVRFPDYLGRATSHSTPHGEGWQATRFTMQAGGFRCDIDMIDATKKLGDQAVREPGYVISHVGELTGTSGPMLPESAHNMLDMLHWLFAFMRGSRTGPILPSASTAFTEGWLELSPWLLDEPNETESWLPVHHMGNFDGLFGGFQTLWMDSVWNEALRSGIAWYLAANATGAYSAVRIPLVQIALEMLAWVHLVTKGNLSPGVFQQAHADGRIRLLLGSLDIPPQVPPRLAELHAFSVGRQCDGVSSLTFLRNKLSHPTAQNNVQLQGVDGVVYMQAAQLGLEFFDLVLLALCGYEGKYACRAFRGWKGDDETIVPWQVGKTNQN